jgi:hypothetical protein
MNRGPLLLASLILFGTALLLISVMTAYDATGHGVTLPAATVAVTSVPSPVPTADKFAAARELATQVAAIPSATRYWPYPTPTLDFIPTDWPPAVPYQAAGAGFILTGAQLGMSSGDFKDTNMWLELLPDRTIRVFAGGDGYIGDPTQGLLVISVKTPAPHRVLIGSIETYRTPTEAGPVTVIDAVGERLTLQADDGTTFYFDVATRQWVNP